MVIYWSLVLYSSHDTTDNRALLRKEDVATTKITIPGHLILPYGTAHAKGKMIKDLSSVRLKAVATNGIYLESDIPVVYIDKSKKEPLDITEGFLRDILDDSALDWKSSPEVIFDYCESYLAGLIDKPTEAQRQFLRIYFKYLKDEAFDIFDRDRSVDKRIYNALLPLPEMQVYVSDPLKDNPYITYAPENNFRVDFGFWTGTKLIAVEIDGNDPKGYASDVRRDRLLRRANIDMFHITNQEVMEYGDKIMSVLPDELTNEWKRRKAMDGAPFIPF